MTLSLFPKAYNVYAYVYIMLDVKSYIPGLCSFTYPFLSTILEWKMESNQLFHGKNNLIPTVNASF